MKIKNNSDLDDVAESNPMLNCEQLEGFIVDYLDSNLPSEQQQKFSHHLSLCSKCEQYLENYQKTIELTQAAFNQTADSQKTEMPEALVQAILASRLKGTL